MKKCIYMTFSETFLVFLVILVVFLGVKFGFRKSCLCKRNDKYKVWLRMSFLPVIFFRLQFHGSSYFSLGIGQRWRWIKRQKDISPCLLHMTQLINCCHICELTPITLRRYQRHADSNTVHRGLCQQLC